RVSLLHQLHGACARALLARPWSARCYGVARQREGSRQNSIGGSGVLSLRHFGLVLYPLILGAWVPKNLARRGWFRPGRCCSTGSGRLDLNLDLLISGPRDLLFYQPHACARALLARPWSARCYGVARQREGSRQNSIGGSGVLSLRHFSGWFSLSLGAWVPKRIWRGEGGSGRLDLDLWFRPARCCSTGSGHPDLDLDLLISGPPRFPFTSATRRVREGAAGQAVVCPLLRGSSPTRGVAPKQHRGTRTSYQHTT